MAISYDLHWKGRQKKWKVVQALSTSSIKRDDILEFTMTTPTTGTVIRTPFGGSPTTVGTCAYDASKDEITVTPSGGGPTFLVKRHVCLIGPPGSGTGASWVAEEGG